MNEVSSGPMRTTVVALACAATLMSGCAARRVDVEWTAPELGPQSGLLRGNDVLVACEAPDVALRNVCQDSLAAEVRARGARPVVVSPDTRLTGDRSLDEQLLSGARRASTRAILVVALRPASSEPTGSGLSIGIGGFGFGRGSAVGGGISAPIGEQRIATGFAANGRVTDVTSGRLVWTATASVPPSDDLRAQCADLAAAVLDSAARAGLF